MVRPVIHAVKHYVQTSLVSVLASAILNTNLIVAVEGPSANTPAEVVEGAIVKAIYIELWARGSELTPGSFVFVIEKRPGISSSVMNTTDMAALQDYENKKNVLFVSQGLSNDTDSIATPLIRGWVKIPKSKQRFGLNDILAWSFFAQGAIDQVLCGFATYKEYR